MKKNSYLLFTSGLVLIFLGLLLQTHLLLSGDVGYLMHASDQLLAGGHYTTDFFETNPPMILYLYAPLYFFTHYLLLSDSVALRTYIFLLGSASALLCYFFLKKILKNDNSVLLHFLFYTVLFVFFILPGTSFGQREHLLIILTMPYLLASVLMLQYHRFSYTLRFLVAVMAAFGFALKPYFLVTFCLIEGYLFLKKKQLFRLESLLIGLILIVYVMSIDLWQKDYLTVILPLVARYYLPFAKQSFIIFLAPPYVLFCLGIIVSYLFFYKKEVDSQFGRILFLALVGFFIALILAKTSWYYHALPALSLAYLLAVFLIVQIKYKPMAILLGVCIFTVPFYSYYAQISYGFALKKHHSMNQVADIIRQSQHRTVYCIPLGTFDCFPFLAAMHGQYVERFPSFWWYTGLRHQEKKISLALQVNQDKNYLIEQAGIDLQQAHWVIFNDSIFKMNEMIAYLSENTVFRNEWAHYRYKTQVGSYQLYERINVGNENDKSSAN